MRLQTRALIVSLLLSATLLLSGCIDIIYQVQVAEDGSGGVRVIAAYDAKQLAALQSSKDQTLTTLVTDDLRLKAAASGLQVDEIQAEGQNGVRVTGMFANPEEFPQALDRIEQLLLSMEQAKLLANLGIKPSLDGTLTVNRDLFATEYELSIPSGTVKKSTDGTSAVMSPIEQATKINYAAVARMPGETVSTNGRYQASDRSLVWPADTKKPSAQNYKAVSRVVNTKAIGLTVAVVVLLLVAIVVLVIFWARRNKHSDSQPNPKRSATSPSTKRKRQ